MIWTYMRSQKKKKSYRRVCFRIDSSIKEFSARCSQFKKLSETLKFIMYPDVTLFGKLKLSQFYRLEIEEFEVRLIDFQCSSIWNQKFVETRKKLKLIYTKNTNNESLEAWNSIPYTFYCLKELTAAIIPTLLSAYACEPLFSGMNNIEHSLRNRLVDDFHSACILL
ncbi:general transcription factor II-I repeat domain-containing protein 2A [Trichonephila clavipes]|nr:general transcription factor II-I repeat domain-containing protein 2A [Trichonephila clavipes]